MSGGDKAEVKLGEHRLVDWVIQRLAPQVDCMLIAGSKNYETGLPIIPDRDDGPLGPAAGLWSASHWIDEHYPEAAGFTSAPVDGPFIPDDLISKLNKKGNCAIACNQQGDHPSFAFWALPMLKKRLSEAPQGEGLALHKLARLCRAERVFFSRQFDLANINDLTDLAHAEERLKLRHCACSQPIKNDGE